VVANVIGDEAPNSGFSKLVPLAIMTIGWAYTSLEILIPLIFSLLSSRSMISGCGSKTLRPLSVWAEVQSQICMPPSVYML